MSQQVIHAYRHLLRTSLQAIRYAKPTRFTLQSHLRHSFRHPKASFNDQEITQTLEFLSNAAKYKGIEQKVVRNLMHVWGCKDRDIPATLKRARKDMDFRDAAYARFDDDVRMLERSLGIRLA
ncbi:hypothetical protein E4T39_02972 [Aureobasidium subglaciale]|nr:hypothetical protein E4T39_02972 [Aureobasidium subglaciale]